MQQISFFRSNGGQDSISAFGKKSLLMELYDTLVAPVGLMTMDTVKDAYKDLKDKQPKPA